MLTSMSEAWVPSSQDSPPVLCHRCGCDLSPGRGDLYVVRIEAFADPYPPVLEAKDLLEDIPAEIDRLIRQMEHMSSCELSEQVYRRLTVHLCAGCYAQWIEDPCRG
jgi:hypothetical protein